MTVRRNNKPILRATKEVGTLGNAQVEVGWIYPGEKHDNTQLTMAQLAIVQEYGATTGKGVVIPPRPMLRTAVKQHGKRWQQDIQKLAKGVLEGKTDTVGALNTLGALVADDVKSVINDSSNWPPNAPATVRKKGKNTPLIDTGEMRDAVAYKLHKK